MKGIKLSPKGVDRTKCWLLQDDGPLRQNWGRDVRVCEGCQMKWTRAPKSLGMLGYYIIFWSELRVCASDELRGMRSRANTLPE